MTLFNRKCTVDEIENDGDSFYGTTLDTLSEMADLVPYPWIGFGLFLCDPTNPDPNFPKNFKISEIPQGQ